MTGGAVIEGEYRYSLWRDWGSGFGRVLWVMLNPSTATAETDDPTIRKVVGFSKRWGYAEAHIVNLFALRSTDPKALKTHPAPVGPKNDAFIRNEAQVAHGIVLAWGANADPFSSPIRARAVAVKQTVYGMDYGDRPPPPIWTLGLTKGGQPKHPLMLAYDTPRIAV